MDSSTRTFAVQKFATMRNTLRKTAERTCFPQNISSVLALPLIVLT